MKYTGGEVIEMIPKGEEVTSKMSMVGCGLQILLLLFVSQLFLWVLVFIALIT